MRGRPGSSNDWRIDKDEALATVQQNWFVIFSLDHLRGDEELYNITKKIKLKLPKKRSSLTNSNDSSLSNKSAILENETTPANTNKMSLADFDPRSPSNEIVR